MFTVLVQTPGAVLRYDFDRRHWSEYSGEASVTSSGAPLVLASGKGHYPTEATGVVYYADKSWAKLGLMISFSATTDASVAVPLLFSLDGTAATHLRALATEPYDLIHRICRGSLRYDNATRQVLFDFESCEGTDEQAIRRATTVAWFQSDDVSALDRWARDIVRRSLGAYWPALAAELVQPDHPHPPIAPSSRVQQIEILLGHIVRCASCLGGTPCGDATAILASCVGSGYGWQRLHRAFSSARRDADGVPLFVKMVNGKYARAILPAGRWTPTSPPAATAHGLVVDSDEGLITFFNAEKQRAGVLLAAVDSHGDTYYVPAQFRLGTGMRDGADWRNFIQRRIRFTASLSAPTAECVLSIIEVGGIEPEQLATALSEAFTHPTGDGLRSSCHTLLIEQLSLYFVGLALRCLQLDGDFPTLKVETAPAGFDRFVRHLVGCEASRTGAACGECDRLLRTVDGAGTVQLVKNLIRSRLAPDVTNDHIMSDLHRLTARSGATAEARREALAELRAVPVSSLFQVISSMAERWPVPTGIAHGAVWTLLAWIALVRLTGPQGERPLRLADETILREGWDERKADAVTGLLNTLVHNENSTDEQVALAACAQAEMGVRQRGTLHPLGVQRVFALANWIESQPLRTLLTSVANRLVKLLVEAEALRPVAPTREMQVSLRAQPLWSCLAAMPIGARHTRSQWLQVYRMFPWMREVMVPAVIDLDPESPTREAFHDPIPLPPQDDMRHQVAQSATDAGAIERALLLLMWHWCALADSPGGELPPLPSLDATRVDGTPDYWKQFLWGANTVTGAEAETMWEDLLAQIDKRKLDPRAENQAWLGALRFRELVTRHNGHWAGLARERLNRLLSEKTDLAVDTRITSLIGLIALVDPDVTAFATTWLQIEGAYHAAGILRERQRCLKHIAIRSDALVLVDMPAIRERLNAALQSDNGFIITDALRALLAAAGLRSSMEWLLIPQLQPFWADDGRFWLNRLARTPSSGLRDQFLALLRDIAIGTTLSGSMALDAAGQALRSLTRIENREGLALVHFHIAHGTLHAVLGWMRDYAPRVVASGTDPYLVDQFVTAACNRGGKELADALVLLSVLETRGLPIGHERWERLDRAARSALVTAEPRPSALLLAGIAAIPAECREPLAALSDVARRLLTTQRETTPVGAVFEYLSALGDENWRADAATDSAATAADALGSEVDRIVCGTPPKAVCDVVAWLDESSSAIEPGIRWSAMVALTGSEAAGGLANLLKKITAVIAEPVETATSGARLPDAIGALREDLISGRIAIDEAAARAARQLGFKYADALTALRKPSGMPPFLARLSPPAAGDASRFQALWQFVRLAMLGAAVDQINSVLHDAGNRTASGDVSMTFDDIEREVARTAVRAATRIDQPWNEVLAMAQSLIALAEWRDVAIETRWDEAAIAKRQAAGRRVGSRFDMRDMSVILENLLSNARKHGAGSTRVIVTETNVEVRANAEGTNDVFFEELNRWVNGFDEVPEPTVRRARTGLRSIRRAIRRNVSLRFSARLQRAERAPQSSALESVFSVAWDVAKPLRVRN